MNIALKIASILFGVELLTMLVLDRLGLQNLWLGALLDALLLTAVASVLIQRWVLRPNERERDRVLALVRADEERWKSALEGAGVGVWELNVHTGEAYHSRRCQEMLGLDDSEPGNDAQAWQRRIRADDLPRRQEALRAYLSGAGAEYRVEMQVMAQDGNWRWILERGMAVDRAPDGAVQRLVGTHTDVTGQRDTEAQLRALATTDALTGMFNRRHFLQRLDEDWAVSQRLPEQPVSVLLLDVDHFKHVNDTHGHAVGDEMLKHCAALINAGLRKSDTAGRLGGEEFAVLLRGADASAARWLAERLRVAVADTPLVVGDLHLSVTVSIGVSGFMIEDTSGMAALKRADAAMYRAKQAGRNRVEVDAAAAAAPAGVAVPGGGVAPLVWRKAHECGHPDIDGQHQELFDLFNRLLDASLGDEADAAVEPLLQQLLAALVRHFRDEEETLRLLGYGELEQHSRLHRALEARAQALAQMYAQGGPAIGEALVFVARELVERHMLVDDRKFHDLTRARAGTVTGVGEPHTH